ncbi:MAG: glycosyltransferase family 4 protein [Dehalococcoidales bacterium]|nr:glycosyltransferase family 4 protein [Dehalococcoidales bacterium]
MQKCIGVIMYQTSSSKGQELVAQRMVREFNKLGQRAYLITSLFHDDKEVIPSEILRKGTGYLYSEDSALDIPVIRVDSYIAKWPPRRIIFRDFMQTLEALVDKYGINVLITHSTLWNGPEDAAKFAIWRRDMCQMGGYKDPIVFCHMSHLQEASPLRYSLNELTFRTAWSKFSLAKIIDTANLILVVTPDEKASQVKMGAKPGKCFLFPGGVDDESFLRFVSEDGNEFFKKYKINPDTRIVSYLGTIEERKNPMAVLKIAEKLKDVKNLRFILAGRGGSNYAREVEKAIQTLPNVIYIGEIDEISKNQLIKASYLNIVMSRLEALGIAQLEFMYNGVPVVTSGVGGQSWVVQDGVEGYHAKGPDDIDGAADAILRLLHDEKKYNQMSANAKEKAGKLTISNLVRELDNAIDQEMIKENKLTTIPPEVQSTLAEPEYALKSWRSGTSGVVATNKRVFIRQGSISRRVTELRYTDIKAIEHTRRYPWRTLVTGLIISIFFLVAPALRSLLSNTFVAHVENLLHDIASVLPAFFSSVAFTQFILPLLPLLVCTVIFFAGARSGFKIYGEGIKPLYLTRRFRDTIGFIREQVDNATLRTTQ